MVRTIIHSYFFYLFAFTLFFGVLLYNLSGLKSMDEISGVILLIFYAIYVFGTKNRNFHIGLLITLCIFLFYLIYSYIVAYNTRQAITLDFLTQIRPYFTFFIVSQMAPTFSDAQKKLLKRLCLCFWALFIPIGIYGFINPSIYTTVLEQPSDFVTSVVCMALVYLYCSDFSVKDRYIFVIILSLGLLASTKFIGFFLLTCGILLYFNHKDILRFNMRTGIALGFVIAITLYIFKSQLTDYLFPTSSATGDEFNYTARTTLYQTSLNILKDFFPLGSGFASFATYASGLHYSPLYTEYGLNSVAGLTPQSWFSISNSYYPSLAQFGIIGICLYSFFWIYIISKSLINYKQKEAIQPFVIVLILACFIFIENISDSVFTSNKGYFAMMFLGFLFGKPKKEEDDDDDDDEIPPFIPVPEPPTRMTAEKSQNIQKEENEDNQAERLKIDDDENDDDDEENIHTEKALESTIEKMKIAQTEDKEEPAAEAIIYKMPPIPIREEDMLMNDSECEKDKDDELIDTALDSDIEEMDEEEEEDDDEEIVDEDETIADETVVPENANFQTTIDDNPNTEEAKDDGLQDLEKEYLTQVSSHKPEDTPATSSDEIFSDEPLWDDDDDDVEDIGNNAPPIAEEEEIVPEVNLPIEEPAPIETETDEEEKPATNQTSEDESEIIEEDEISELPLIEESKIKKEEEPATEQTSEDESEIIEEDEISEQPLIEEPEIEKEEEVENFAIEKEEEENEEPATSLVSDFGEVIEEYKFPEEITPEEIIVSKTENADEAILEASETETYTEPEVPELKPEPELELKSEPKLVLEPEVEPEPKSEPKLEPELQSDQKPEVTETATITNDFPDELFKEKTTEPTEQPSQSSDKDKDEDDEAPIDYVI